MCFFGIYSYHVGALYGIYLLHTGLIRKPLRTTRMIVTGLKAGTHYPCSGVVNTGSVCRSLMVPMSDRGLVLASSLGASGNFSFLFQPVGRRLQDTFSVPTDMSVRRNCAGSFRREC